MAKINLKESIAALKKLKEEELEKLATDAEIAGEPEKNEANEEGKMVEWEVKQLYIMDKNDIIIILIIYLNRSR